MSDRVVHLRLKIPISLAEQDANRVAAGICRHYVKFASRTLGDTVAVGHQQCYTTNPMGEATQTRSLDARLFRDLFNASPIGIAVENLEGQPLFANPALCAMLGFSEEELCSIHRADFSPPEDAWKDWAFFQQLRAGAIDHYHLEKRYFRRDGSSFWGSLSISLLNHRQSPLVVAMLEDITEQKRAEEARFRHAAFVESSDDAIASVTLDGVIASWNAGAQRMFGYTESEAVGKSVTILVPPERADEENKILETLKAGGRIDQFETVRVTKTGERISVFLSISPIKDSTGKIVGFSGISRDITERKRAEEALRASEERLRLAQQVAHIGAFEWNIRTGVNTWTPELEAMYGLPPGGFGGTQTAWENLVHPDDLAGVLQWVDEALKTGRPMTGEWRVVWPDGSVHWIAGRWQVLMSGSGDPLRMVGINIDVTEHRQADQALRESEQRLRLAIQAGKMYAYEWDIATDKVVRSEEFSNILGSSEPSCFSRKQLLDRVHPDDRAQFTAAVGNPTPENPTNHITYRVIRADGAVIWLEKYGRAFFDAKGRMLRMIGMVADVTERKRTEERLREYEKAVEGAEDMIGVIDREYRFLLANRQYLKMRNMTREQVVGRFVPEVLNAEVFETVIKPKLDECFRGKVVRYEMKFSYPTVGERDLLLSYFPIEGPSGIDRVVCILRDITDRKRAEEVLSGMTRKLIEAQEQERSRIGRELHDDINQRLAMLALELEQLRENPSEVETRVQELQKRLGDISDQVQALSHDLHSTKLEYLGVAAGMKSWCKDFAERQKMEIDFNSDVQRVLPLDVGLCLFRVLQEALHNVMKHSGVRRVELQLREDPSEIQLIVSDLGRGFDIEVAMRGNGLGLTSMRERVRLVNGTIAIDSKPMGGTTIHVRVPFRSKDISEQVVG